MTTVKEKINTIPVKISQLIHGTWAVQALRAAIELKVFDYLDKEPKDIPSLASGMKVNQRALTMFFDALVAIGLLKKHHNLYSLTDESRTYLVSSAELYIGRYIKMAYEREDAWLKLGDVVKSGNAIDHVNEDKRAQEFFPALAEMIFPMNFAIAQRVNDELKVSRLGPSAKVLDVAAGAATWSIPMALANKSVNVDALDFPSTLEVTKKYATKYGVESQYNYIGGNWREVAWQKNAYDLVILGHILHSEGEKLSCDLIERCFAAVKPNGKIVIAEMIADDERNGPPFPMLFGVNMLINTSEGCVFTERELKQMLTTAGFVSPYRMPVSDMPYSPIIIASKPA
jgi:ubiquinone/menaquinone biosynthesis C-methylase UbiE